MSEIDDLRSQLAQRDGWLKEIAEVLIEAGADGNLGIVDGARAFVAAAVAARGGRRRGRGTRDRAAIAGQEVGRG